MRVSVKELIGKTLISIKVNKYGNAQVEDELIFTTSEVENYRMYHEGDCCESVTIDDIVGDLDDLLNTPITMAEEIIEKRPDDTEYKDYFSESSTFTFYKFATIKGYVTIRWFGESNGFYSETVDFVKIK